MQGCTTPADALAQIGDDHQLTSHIRTYCRSCRWPQTALHRCEDKSRHGRLLINGTPWPRESQISFGRQPLTASTGSGHFGASRTGRRSASAPNVRAASATAGLGEHEQSSSEGRDCSVDRAPALTADRCFLEQRRWFPLGAVGLAPMGRDGCNAGRIQQPDARDETARARSKRQSVSATSSRPSRRLLPARSEPELSVVERFLPSFHLGRVSCACATVLRHNRGGIRAMPLPRELWPGRGSWQTGPPPEEQRRGRGSQVDKRGRMFHSPRVALRRRMMPRLGWRRRRTSGSGAHDPPGAPGKEEA